MKPLRRSLRISPDARLRIRHLLLVAGASGAGKSTFLRQLQSGELSPELSAMLPPGASGWPQTNGSRIRGKIEATGDAAGTRLVHGVVLHYDIMRVCETSIADYTEDPALAALGKADAITIVLIRPSAEHLVRQLGQKRPGPGRFGRMLRNLERRFRRLTGLGRIAVYRPEATRQRHAQLSQRYGRPGFLDESYRDWERFLHRSVGSRLKAPIIRVEPVEMPGGRQAFRLLGGE